MDRFDFRIGQYTLHIYTTTIKEKRFLLESRDKGVPLGGPYSVQRHHPHAPPGQNHLHVFLKNNQLFALNQDGTAHDRSHRVRIPNQVARAIAVRFPDFTVPEGNLIESADIIVELDFLVELKMSDLAEWHQ